MMNRWTLYATDQVGTRQAMIDVYESAEVVARTNDTSTWTLTVPTGTDAGRIFATNTFARLEVAVDDVAWRSGPVTNLERTVDIDGDMLTVAGVDDTVWLARRNAHPQPATPAPPYSTSAYDVHTGATTTVLAELVDVNAGPGAVAARRVPGLVVPMPEPDGPTVTVAARWQNLLTLCQDTARAAGVIFDVVDLTFHAEIPADRGVVFSQGLETLAGWTLTAPAPTANKVVVAGQGELTDRLIREASDPTSIATWGLAETFQDRRDTADVAQLDQAGADTLAQSVTPTTVVFTPLDTEGQAFGRDWNLGDTVTVHAGGLTVVDQIREIHVTLDGAVATVVPSVGAPAGDLALFRSLAGLDRRVRQLERV
jgi:hypothetical protein